MQPTTDLTQLDQLIIQRLPILVRQNREIQELVLALARENFADRQETGDRFNQLLTELKRDREEQSRQWAEQNRRWEENQKVINEMLAPIHHLDKKYDQTMGITFRRSISQHPGRYSAGVS